MEEEREGEQEASAATVADDAKFKKWTAHAWNGNENGHKSHHTRLNLISRDTLRLGQPRLDSNTQIHTDTQIMAMAMATTGQSGGNIVATVIQCAICG